MTVLQDLSHLHSSNKTESTTKQQICFFPSMFILEELAFKYKQVLFALVIKRL